MYTRNIGNNDKILRFILAIILLLIVALFDFNLALRWAIGIIGIILFITAVVNWCPLYSILNHSSKGQGLDKITQRDIQEAVKEYSLKTTPNRVEVDIKAQSAKKKAKAPAKKKATTKKVATKKKSTASKKSANTATKKAPAKKKATTKKTSTKTVTKKAPTKKKTTAKKTTTKKKTTPKKKATTTKSKPKK